MHTSEFWRHATDSRAGYHSMRATGGEFEVGKMDDLGQS